MRKINPLKALLGIIYSTILFGATAEIIKNKIEEYDLAEQQSRITELKDECLHIRINSLEDALSKGLKQGNLVEFIDSRGMIRVLPYEQGKDYSPLINQGYKPKWILQE